MGEGIEPDYSRMEQVFFSKAEREKGLLSDFFQEAKQKGHSLAHEIVENRRIDFGNYQNCKDAYSKGYGLRFPEDLGIQVEVIQSLVKTIEYRNRIVHVSPFIGVLNRLEVPKEKPVFPDKALVNDSVKNFDFFVNGLHKATLRLNRK